MKSTIRLMHYKKDLMRGFETDARADEKQMTYFFWPYIDLLKVSSEAKTNNMRYPHV